MNEIGELAKLLESLHAIALYFLAVLLFGFLPGFTLRLLVKLYPPGDERRQVLLADMYERPRSKRWFFVAEQLETVLVEGLPDRIRRRRLPVPAVAILPLLESILYLARDDEGGHHAVDVVELAKQMVYTGRKQFLSHTQVDCGRDDCVIRYIVTVPVVTEGNIVGTLSVLSACTAGPALLQATAEMASFISQLELTELDESQALLAHAEVHRESKALAWLQKALQEQKVKIVMTDASGIRVAAVDDLRPPTMA